MQQHELSHKGLDLVMITINNYAVSYSKAHRAFMDNPRVS